MLGGWPGIDDSEREAIFFIADISGHTTFIFANEKEVSHSLMVIREIITSLMNRVVTPLQLVRIEGDAIFLYVLKDAPEHPCGKVSKTLASDMAAFFQVFSHELSELMIHKVCNCNACVHIEQLKLKVVARGGTAAFYQLGDHQELTGTSPIVIHRLMKNSVQATEYMLFTVSAYRDIAPTDWEVEAGEEDHDDIGNIKTFLHYPLEPETFVLSSDSKPPAVLIDTLRSEVSREYCQVAQNPELGFHFHTGRRLTALLEYRNHWLDGLPEETTESFAGTGNPFLLGDICPDEKVVDAGSETIGIVMTQEMVDKATKTPKLQVLRTALFSREFSRNCLWKTGGPTLSSPTGQSTWHRAKGGIQGIEPRIETRRAHADSRYPSRQTDTGKREEKHRPLEWLNRRRSAGSIASG